MEQFVLVPASVYNMSLKTQSVAKQELPKYQALLIPTYRIHALKKEISETLFDKADPLVDRVLSCSRIKLSKKQTLTLQCRNW